MTGASLMASGRVPSTIVTRGLNTEALQTERSYEGRQKRIRVRGPNMVLRLITHKRARSW